MQKIKAKQTLAGDYGIKYAGDEFEVKNTLATELIAKGLAEAVGEESKEDGAKAPEGSEAHKEKASVNIADNTNKEKRNILKPGKSE